MERQSDRKILLQAPKCDGYRWRKYGTKILKNTMLPRTYFKCDYPNCGAKKILEYDADGSITKINYKTYHNHAKMDGLQTPSFTAEDEIDELTINECDDDNITELRETRQRFSSDENYIFKLKTNSENPDDGYHWVKYGHKPVEKNPNPRSYYKCRAPDCNVRKMVERILQEPEFLRIRFKDKHNHEVPPPRGNNRVVPPTRTPQNHGNQRFDFGINNNSWSAMSVSLITPSTNRSSAHNVDIRAVESSIQTPQVSLRITPPPHEATMAMPIDEIRKFLLEDDDSSHHTQTCTATTEALEPASDPDQDIFADIDVEGCHPINGGPQNIFFDNFDIEQDNNNFHSGIRPKAHL